MKRLYNDLLKPNGSLEDLVVSEEEMLGKLFREGVCIRRSVVYSYFILAYA